MQSEPSNPTGSERDGLTGVLNSIINNTLPGLVDTTVPTVVHSTVKSTSDVINTTTGILTTVVGGKKPATTPTSRPTSPAQQPTTLSGAPTKEPTTTPASGAAPGSTPAITPPGRQIQAAPLEGPNLIATTADPSHRPTGEPARQRHADALTPSSLLTAPGTGILIGVVLVFGLGVFLVVYGAGYRGRRVH